MIAASTLFILVNVSVNTRDMDNVCTKEIPLSKYVVRVLKLLRPRRQARLYFILLWLSPRPLTFSTESSFVTRLFLRYAFPRDGTSVTSSNEPLMYKLYFGFCFEYYKRIAQAAVVINASFSFSAFFFFIRWNWSPVKLSFTFVESAERVPELYFSELLFRTHFFNASRHNWHSTTGTFSTIPPPLAITPSVNWSFVRNPSYEIASVSRHPSNFREVQIDALSLDTDAVNFSHPSLFEIAND